jgi:CheY-like chemotaxis protein
MSDSKALTSLFPGPRRRILSALYGEPERWWSLTELSGRAGIQPGSVRSHVIHLRDCGIIREKHNDGHHVFQANPASPIYAELQAIVSKLTSKAEASETILVVEDQPATAQITRILLESWGYRVHEAHRASEAFLIFEEHGDSIRLLLTDMIMPEMNGHQLAHELLRRKPSLRIIFMSGYPADEVLPRDTAFLPKPFNPASLSRIVRKELDRAEPVRHMNWASD